MLDIAASHHSSLERDRPSTTPLLGKRVLIVVENLPVPFDRRVWQEARTLRDAGARVAIICPTGKGFTATYEELEGIHVYRHTLPADADSAMGYLPRIFRGLVG